MHSRNVIMEKRLQLRRIDPRNPPQRNGTPEAVRKLLEPISTIDVGDLSSPESDVPDAFEEVHEDSFFHSKKSGQKHITKYEADVLTMGQFTDLHKSTIRDLRQEFKIDDNLLSATYDDIVRAIKCPKEQKPLLPETVDSIKKTLSDPGIVTLPEVIRAGHSETSYDYVSGVWDMLRERCKGGELVITPEGYDAYNQSEPHWLERPCVPQEVLDDSNAKCNKWLSEQHE